MDYYFQDLDGAKSKTMGRLKCSICGKTFIDPRRLPCGHTFCLNCVHQLCVELQEISSHRIGSFPCPTCKSLIGMPSSGASGFPLDAGIDKVKEKAVDEMARILLQKFGRHNEDASATDGCSNKATNSNFTDENSDDESREEERDESGYSRFSRQGLYGSEKPRSGRSNLRFASMRESRSKRSTFDPHTAYQESSSKRKSPSREFVSFERNFTSQCEVPKAQNSCKTEPDLQDYFKSNIFARDDSTRSSFTARSTASEFKMDETCESAQKDAPLPFPTLRRSFSLREKIRRTQTHAADIFDYASHENGSENGNRQSETEDLRRLETNRDSSSRPTFILPERVVVFDDAEAKKKKVPTATLR